jgi:hypothetical protein
LYLEKLIMVSYSAKADLRVQSEKCKIINGVVLRRGGLKGFV